MTYEYESQWIHTDTRNRLSFESVLSDTGCVLPITGIPCEVPVPKK